MAFQSLPNGSVETVVNARVPLPTEAAKSKEWCLTSLSANVNYLNNRFATDENIAKINADI